MLTHGGFLISGIAAVRHLRDDDEIDNNGPEAKRPGGIAVVSARYGFSAMVLGKTNDDEIRLWLDDDLVDRAAPPGWTHVTTVKDATDLLNTGRVVELSLDHDLGDDELAGRGIHVVDWLAEQQEAYGRILWPRDGLVVHSANPAGRDAMIRAAENYAAKVVQVRRSLTPSGKPRLTFSPQ